MRDEPESKTRESSSAKRPSAGRSTGPAGSRLVGAARWVAGRVASAAAVWTCLAGVAGNAFAGDELPPAAGETTIPGGWLALVSYLALWIGVGAYLLYLGRRYTALADRLEALESRIDAVFDDDTEDRTTGE